MARRSRAARPRKCSPMTRVLAFPEPKQTPTPTLTLTLTLGVTYGGKRSFRLDSDATPPFLARG